MFLMSQVPSEMTLEIQRRGLWDQGVDFDTAPLPPHPRECRDRVRSLGTHFPCAPNRPRLVSSRLVPPFATKQGQEDPCAKLFRGPKVKTTVCFYGAPLDIRVELFRLIRCDEDTDILSKAIAIGSRRWDMNVHRKPI
jgi:hypothetical protein